MASDVMGFVAAGASEGPLLVHRLTPPKAVVAEEASAATTTSKRRERKRSSVAYCMGSLSRDNQIAASSGKSLEKH
jgi:hypothetical protein